jgi:hypothetical protein
MSIAALTTLGAPLPELRPRDTDAADASRADDARPVRDGAIARAVPSSREAALAAAEPESAPARRLAERAALLGPLTYGRGTPLPATTVAARGARLDVTA